MSELATALFTVLTSTLRAKGPTCSLCPGGHESIKWGQLMGNCKQHGLPVLICYGDQGFPEGSTTGINWDQTMSAHRPGGGWGQWPKATCYACRSQGWGWLPWGCGST